MKTAEHIMMLKHKACPYARRSEIDGTLPLKKLKYRGRLHVKRSVANTLTGKESWLISPALFSTVFIPLTTHPVLPTIPQSPTPSCNTSQIPLAKLISSLWQDPLPSHKTIIQLVEVMFKEQ